jgi:serine/threonine-protein kinase
VLYELLTGARPFPGESITTLVYQILHTEPKDPLEWKSDLPIATREVIARLLAKSPDRRPANAKEFVHELARIEKIHRESELTRRALAEVPPTRPFATVPAGAAAPPPAPEPPKRRSGMPVILGALAVLVAASFLLLRDTRRGLARLPPAAAPVARATPAPTAPPPTVAAEPSPVPTEVATVAPTSAPTAAPRATPRRRATAVAAAPAPPAPIAPPPSAAPPAKPERIDSQVETRRAVRFTSSPDQARLFLDGRYIGIADDWDNRGGGRELEFSKPGTHYVRMELPGYRPHVVEIDVTDEAGKDSPSIDDEMERRDRVAYDRLPAPSGQTTGAVEFSVEPPGVTITENGREIGPASSFGPASPLQLKGPAVHDLILAASGYRPKLVRILVAPNAGKDRARVVEKLKTD